MTLAQILAEIRAKIYTNLVGGVTAAGLQQTLLDMANTLGALATTAMSAASISAASALSSATQAALSATQALASATQAQVYSVNAGMAYLDWNLDSDPSIGGYDWNLETVLSTPTIQVGDPTSLWLANLPTTMPATVGAWWNNGGVLSQVKP